MITGPITPSSKLLLPFSYISLERNELSPLLSFPTSLLDDLLHEVITEKTSKDPNYWSFPSRSYRDSAHAIFQYPAMMVPLVQKRLLAILLLIKPDIKSMIDPFVGSGSTITAGMSCKLDCYGQDINPLAVLITKTKSELGWQDAQLAEAFTEVTREINNDTSEKIEVDFPNIKKWFQPNVLIELSKIRRAINRQEDLTIRRILWVTLAETIRLTSNDRTTTFKLHARPIEEIMTRDVSVQNTFLRLLRNNITDLIAHKSWLSAHGYYLNNHYLGKIKVSVADTSKEVILQENGNNKYDLLLTSPPYGDNTSTITYGQHSYLPLQWINLEDIDDDINPECLRTTQEIDRESLGGKSVSNLKQTIDELSFSSDSLRRTFESLKNQPIDRKARIATFYNDFSIALDLICESVRTNGYMIWTVGNRRVGGVEVPNDKILYELIETKGYKLISSILRTIHNKRMPHKNDRSQMMKSEKILFFRKVRD
jgi:hypothetical protein